MNMNDKYIYKTTMTFGEVTNYNVRTTYIDDEGIKRLLILINGRELGRDKRYETVGVRF